MDNLTDKEIQKRIDELSADKEYIKELKDHVQRVIDTNNELAKCYIISPETWQAVIANI
jgi:hypothetical protein